MSTKMYSKNFENPLLTLVMVAVIYTNMTTAARNPLRSIAKFTDIRCRAIAPHLMYFKECRIQRDENVTKAILLCHIYDKPLKQIKIKLRGYRKIKVGYVLFVLDISLDWCEFLKNRKNEVVKRLFGVLEKASNFNTTCSVDLDYTFMNASMSKDSVFEIPFKWLLGDYRLDINMDANEEIHLIINAFFRLEW